MKIIRFLDDLTYSFWCMAERWFLAIGTFGMDFLFWILFFFLIILINSTR